MAALPLAERVFMAVIVPVHRCTMRQYQSYNETFHIRSISEMKLMQSICYLDVAHKFISKKAHISDGEGYSLSSIWA